MEPSHTVVITGAGSGLGESLARKYSAQGSHICLLGRKKDRLQRTANQLFDSFSIYEVDVSKKQDVERVVQEIVAARGSIDLWINNAGTGSFDLAENLSEEDVHIMIDSNLKGTIFCTQEVLKPMKKSNQGCIVNIISTAGKVGKVNESVYCASKFGVRGFTESLHLELKDTPLQVLGVYMGGMRTEFWDGIFSEERTQGLMDPDDIADIIIENVKPRKRLVVSEVVILNS
ncbi:SDR family oxidoreductase [Brevibacillus daliensis]|uniref:SDR family oxidoreductase n=1 Tax=Brevibacillus daliensis TaxID=2892995 RepID=UPI001E444A45|nr:SDR family oxidoreductase [Brevibacillus daliensis]